MSADRYLKVVLTVIAIELGWLAIQHAGVPVFAQRAAPVTPRVDPMPVVIRGIELTQQEVLPVALVNSNATVRVTSARPLQIEQPLIVQNDRPLIVETGSRPLVIQSVPAQPALRPGPGE